MLIGPHFGFVAQKAEAARQISKDRESRTCQSCRKLWKGSLKWLECDAHPKDTCVYTVCPLLPCRRQMELHEEEVRKEIVATVAEQLAPEEEESVLGKKRSADTQEVEDAAPPRPRRSCRNK